MSDYRSPFLFEARKIAAARELSRGAAHGSAAHGSVVRSTAFPGTMPRDERLAGLGCECQVRYTGGGLKGYRAAILNGVHKTQLHGLSQSRPEGTPALIPVSDRKAVEAAVKLFKGLKP